MNSFSKLISESKTNHFSPKNPLTPPPGSHWLYFPFSFKNFFFFCVLYLYKSYCFNSFCFIFILIYCKYKYIIYTIYNFNINTNIYEIKLFFLKWKFGLRYLEKREFISKLILKLDLVVLYKGNSSVFEFSFNFACLSISRWINWILELLIVLSKIM